MLTSLCSGAHTPLHKSYFQVPIASRSVADDKLSYGALFQKLCKFIQYTYIYFYDLFLSLVFKTRIQ